MVDRRYVLQHWNISMSYRIKYFFVLGIVSSIISGMFWFVYSFTENIVGSIGITAGVSISMFGILYKLGQIKKS